MSSFMRTFHTPFLNTFRTRARSIIVDWLKSENISIESFGKEELAEAIRSRRFNRSLPGLGATTFAEICEAIGYDIALTSSSAHQKLNGAYQVTVCVFRHELSATEKEQLLGDIRDLGNVGVEFVESEGHHGLVIWNQNRTVDVRVQKKLRQSGIFQHLQGGGRMAKHFVDAMAQPVAWFKEFAPILEGKRTQGFANLPAASLPSEGPIQFRFPEGIEKRLRAATSKYKTTMNAIVTQSLNQMLPLEGSEESQLNSDNFAQYRRNLHEQLIDVLKLAQLLNNQSRRLAMETNPDVVLILAQEEEKKIQALCKQVFFFDRFGDHD